MTDEDVIARVASLFGTAYTSARQDRRNPKWKPYYLAMLRGAKAMALMRELFPLMGQRRKGQITRALDSYEGPKRRDKLTKAVRKAIWSSKLTDAELARKYNVSRTSIHKIKRNGAKSSGTLA